VAEFDGGDWGYDTAYKAFEWSKVSVSTIVGPYLTLVLYCAKARFGIKGTLR